ncbi:MAG: hypothetical protein OQJ74_02680, partial [Ignavibacteriaceae bacterium]|nr:hypothetical protein [Ignavibacteriaceae bacterium]
SSLHQIRNKVVRADFTQNEAFCELSNFWDLEASIDAGSSTLTITTQLDHGLETGDFVTIKSGDSVFYGLGTGLSQSSFENAIYSVQSFTQKTFTVNLISTALTSLNARIELRFGRTGVPAVLTLSSGSAIATLSISSEADIGWLVGDEVIVGRPFSTLLKASLSLQSDLENSRPLSFVAPNTLTIALSNPAVSNFSGSVEFSEKRTTNSQKIFSLKKQDLISSSEIAFLHRDATLIFPFDSVETTTRIQGFLERNLDQDWKCDRPSKVFDGIPITLMTSRIHGGDPCSLKNFEQIIITWQSILSCTICDISFQGDRYGAVSGITFRSQSNIDSPFDPAFGDVLWSNIFQQWDSITNPNVGWKEGGPFTPVRVTTPNNVSQSTYLSIIIRHSRPFETFALGSIAVNGVFIDPTSSGV